MHPITAVLLSLALALAPAALGESQRHNLISPQVFGKWSSFPKTSIDPRFKFLPEAKGLEITRPHWKLNPLVLHIPFSKDGPSDRKTALAHPVRLLENGDTIGARIVLSFNSKANLSKGGEVIRLGFANSGKLLPSANLEKASDPAFSDDASWTAFYSLGEKKGRFWATKAESEITERFYPGSMRIAGAKVEWRSSIPVPSDPADKPIEAIFSITRVSEKQVRLYAFCLDQEFESTSAEVADFTYDSLYLNFPLEGEDQNSAAHITEFEIHLPKSKTETIPPNPPKQP